MTNTFFDKSKKIADDFIQSIVFLDDRTYNRQDVAAQGNVNNLEASEISKIFAREKKICAVYDPESLEDIQNFKTVALKSDVVILDWFIDIPQVVILGEEEEDAEEDDNRGMYTLDIISHLLKEDLDNLRIIIVYTGETDLQNIANKIQIKNPTLSLDSDNLKLAVGSITIFVRAKSDTQVGQDIRFNHTPTLKNKVLKYSQLPDFILTQFTLKTAGLLSNFALLSLSTLRNNTSKILGLYDKSLDHAFLDHKSSIPNNDDAENLILDVFKDSIGDLLHYKRVHKSISKKDVSSWMTNTLKTENKTIKNAEGDDITPAKEILRTKQFLLNLLYSSEKDVQKRFINNLIAEGLSKSQAEKYFKYLKSNNIDLFINEDQILEKENFVKQFAKLTHHKNVFLPTGVKPILSLGSVIKSSKSSQYYICIQQKCDSVRIEHSIPRKFLFLPLKESISHNFNFISQDGTKLQLESKSYSIRTLKFKSNKDGVVVPIKQKDKFFFEQIYNNRSDEKFQWILDLKDLHSQRIVADYAATISRVGLDESDWLRRASSK